MPSHYPSETLHPLAHSSVASNHSILTHSSPNLNIRHLATARASDSSYMLDYVARYKFSYVCMYYPFLNPAEVNRAELALAHNMPANALNTDDQTYPKYR